MYPDRGVACICQYILRVFLCGEVVVSEMLSNSFNIIDQDSEFTIARIITDC